MPDFPALESMRTGFLEIKDPIQFTDFFLPLNNLRKLSIQIRNTQPSREELWLNLLQIIKLKHSRSLQELYIQDGLRCNKNYHDVGVTPLSNALIFEVASDFMALTSINIANTEGFNIVDEDLKLMTAALPLLERFSLINYTTSASTKENKITVASLAFFAQNCPRSFSLALAFDAGSDKIPSRQSRTPIPGPRLERLYVPFSRIDDSRLVASFLFDIFTSIKLLEWSDDDFQRYGRLWSEVRVFLSGHRVGTVANI